VDFFFLIIYLSTGFVTGIYLKETRALDTTETQVPQILVYTLICDSLQPCTQLCTVGIKQLEKANLRLSVCNSKVFLIVNIDLQISRGTRQPMGFLQSDSNNDKYFVYFLQWLKNTDTYSTESVDLKAQ